MNKLGLCKQRQNYFRVLNVRFSLVFSSFFLAFFFLLPPTVKVVSDFIECIIHCQQSRSRDARRPGEKITELQLG